MTVPTLLCYCTTLSVDDFLEACRAGRWPLPGHDRAGKLCTGCLGDLLHLLRQHDLPAEP